MDSKNLSLLLDGEYSDSLDKGKFIRLSKGDLKKGLQVQCELAKDCDMKPLSIRLFVDVKQSDTIDTLKTKIVELISESNEVFRDLSQLSVSTLYKQNDRVLGRLNSTDEALDVLQDEEAIQFDLTSLDVWVKVFMKISSNDKTYRWVYEARVNRDTTILQLKHYIYKWIITLWNQLSIHNLKDATFYFLDEVRIVKRIFKGDRENYIESFKNESEKGRYAFDLKENLLNKNNSNIEEIEMEDDRKIDDYFDFKSSILVNATFTSIEEIHMLKSANYERSNIYKNSLNEETSRDTGKFKVLYEQSKEMEKDNVTNNQSNDQSPAKLKEFSRTRCELKLYNQIQ